MEKKAKMTRDTVPEDFTLSLALVDALPVLLFGGSMLLIGAIFSRGLFLAGALLCFWAGAAKVLWKIIVVLRKKNIWFLFLQMRIAMPAGFGFMLLSLLLNRDAVSFPGILSALTTPPSAYLFAAGLFGMVLMGFFGAKLDASDVRSNWIEQLTNAAAQGCIFAGLWLLL